MMTKRMIMAAMIMKVKNYDTMTVLMIILTVMMLRVKTITIK